MQPNICGTQVYNVQHNICGTQVYNVQHNICGKQVYNVQPNICGTQVYNNIPYPCQESESCVEKTKRILVNRSTRSQGNKLIIHCISIELYS